MELNEHQCKVLDEMLDGDSNAPRQKKSTTKGSKVKKTEPQTSERQEPQQLPLDAIDQVAQHRTESDNKVAEHIMLVRQVSDQESQSLEKSAEDFATMAGYRDALTIMSVRGKKKAYTAHFLDQFNSLQVNPDVTFTAMENLELQLQESLKCRPTLFTPSTRQLAYQEEVAALPEYQPELNSEV